jgi:hypothetical protein
MRYNDRYKDFVINDVQKVVPFVKLSEKTTDKFITFELNKTRFDKVSSEIYGSPYHGYLILLANPEYGGLENLIPDQTVIRVPFPLKETLRELNDKIGAYKRMYGTE